MLRFSFGFVFTFLFAIAIIFNTKYKLIGNPVVIS
jgi:hypothetical protein